MHHHSTLHPLQLQVAGQELHARPTFGSAKATRLTQNQFQSFFELPDMDQTRPANAKVILTFVMGFVFMPVWPYAILIACAALFLEYWAFKYQLLRHSKRPYWRRCRQCGPEDSHGFSTLPWRVMVLHRSIQTPPGSGGWCWTVLDGAGWCK